MRGTEETAPEMASGEQAPLWRSETSNRRSAVRNLTATLLALAGGGVAVAGARKKQKRKTGRNSSGSQRRKTCRRGRILANLAVPADGSEISTPVLRKRQRYTLRATGFWATNGSYFNDAVAAFLAADPSQVAFTDLGVRLGLSVDGRSPDIWGAYTPAHEYTMSLPGQERRVSLRMQDSDYADNSRLLNVEVICG